jgi:hypothetical protein
MHHLMMAGISFAFNCAFLLVANLLQLEWIYNELVGRQKKEI